ncbi:MAG TPA: GTP 3',8-cyclase MoaA [Acidimicrobiales bacterium]|nr:GTP 3',8-cyclase MoaA [Acidimicrobiales bacterium]
MTEVPHGTGPTAGPLVDPHGRTVRDLRISVTDRCNFRCTYCMPEEGMDWLSRDDLLSFEEIDRVARVCVERFGFTGIRLTGGEPTVRNHITVLIEKLAALGTDLAMTTNGATLAGLAPDLRAAGLRRLNISCDSLRRDRFRELTKRDRLPQVLAGIDAALAAGFDPVKVNVVPIRGVNDDELVDFADFGREKGVIVRFIEMMPLDAQHEWSRDRMVPAAEIVEAIGRVHPLVPVEERGNQPAERFRFADGTGEIGVVASVTRSFCSTCDRVRLTAEGMFRNCLFALRETDLRAVLRGGGTDDDLAAAIADEVGQKWAGHTIGQVSFVQPARAMSQIGG